MGVLQYGKVFGVSQVVNLSYSLERVFKDGSVFCSHVASVFVARARSRALDRPV